jgi:deoxyadenosine/deoxycytidine kinase
MSSFLEPPNLVVYLRCSVDTLKTRIARRGRTFEADIPDEYLENLNRLYDHWIEGYGDSPELVIDADKLDFVLNPEDLDEILDRIEEGLRGDQGELW